MTLGSTPTSVWSKERLLAMDYSTGMILTLAFFLPSHVKLSPASVGIFKILCGAKYESAYLVNCTFKGSLAGFLLIVITRLVAALILR